MSLRCQDLSVDLAGRRLLDRFGLEVSTGGWTAVIGPNGAGKSTALRALAGLVDHTGEVEVGGVDLADCSTRDRARRLAFVPQNPVIPPAVTVHDYVLLGRTPYLGPLAALSASDHDLVGGVIDRLDLTALAGRSLDSLSGGERQRAILGRALAQQSDVLLLDEPTTALDLGHQIEVLDQVEQLRHQGSLTVVCTMHDLSLAGQYADTIVLLDEGHIVASGAPATVLTPELISRHYRTTVDVFDSAHGPVVVPIRQSST